jgi:hypothetical protein
MRLPFSQGGREITSRSDRFRADRPEYRRDAVTEPTAIRWAVASRAKRNQECGRLRALFFTASIALGSGLLAGIWPAWQIARTASLTDALHEVGLRGGSGGIRRHRARAMLMVSQVALAVILLAGAGLTLKSFWRAQGEPLGFEPRGILTMVITLPQARYDKREKIAAFHVQLLDRVRSLPGVAGVAIGANVPFDDTEWDSSF